jgi:hypothetical protein
MWVKVLMAVWLRTSVSWDVTIHCLVKQSNKNLLHGHLDPWRQWHHATTIYWEPLSQWYSITHPRRPKSYLYFIHNKLPSSVYFSLVILYFCYWHFTLMIYSDVCDKPRLLAVLLHIKAAGCLAHGSTASNLKSYNLCSSSTAVIYRTHLALICDQIAHTRGVRKN